jgi:hypothetical protein
VVVWGSRSSCAGGRARHLRQHTSWRRHCWGSRSAEAAPAILATTESSSSSDHGDQLAQTTDWRGGDRGGVGPASRAYWAPTAAMEESTGARPDPVPPFLLPAVHSPRSHGHCVVLVRSTSEHGAHRVPRVIQVHSGTTLAGLPPQAGKHATNGNDMASSLPHILDVLMPMPCCMQQVPHEFATRFGGARLEL